MKLRATLLLFMVGVVFSACGRGSGITEEEALRLQEQNSSGIFSKTIYKPGPPIYDIGKNGGVYYKYIQNDPKSFNSLNARDNFTAEVTDFLYPRLFNYNPYTKEYEADLASFKVEYDETNNKTYVDATLRDDVYWTSANGRKEKITSDDLIFWYEEVEGDKAVQHPGYPGQFITLPDGSKEQIIIQKIDAHTVRFNIPVIIANPLLYVDMRFGPRYLYKAAKDANGVTGMLDILSIDVDPKTVPSAGKYMLSEFRTGQYVELIKNPDYWKKDEQGNKLPYIDTIHIKIIPSDDTALLSFKQGELSSYGARPEDVDSLISDQEKGIYDVYRAGASLSSSFLTFNQNPNVLPEYKYKWFTNKYFRQAMSSLMPRERIIEEVYRGLAEPAVYFFAKANMFFDESIKLEYTYDVGKAEKLLKKAGFKKNADGLYADKDGNVLEFDLNMGTENTVAQDLASIYAEELKNVGVTVNVKPIDFQQLVERLTKSYQWDAVLVGLAANYWPSSGSNVWQSNGNFHLWYPLQEEPATDWEAKIDELYQKGLYTIDIKERKRIYDEYQKLILEELPLIYLVYPEGFAGYNKAIQNLYLDNLEGATIEYIYISE